MTINQLQSKWNYQPRAAVLQMTVLSNRIKANDYVTYIGKQHSLNIKMRMVFCYDQGFKDIAF